MTDQYVSEVVAIGERGKKVVLEFEKPTQWAAFDPETAKNIGLEITKVSYKITTGKDVEPVQLITQETENKLVQRLTLVITDMQKKGKLPGFIANECMGIVLREVS